MSCGETEVNGSSANWVSPTIDAHRSYGVFLFRNSFDLESLPSSLPIKVSADNRYKLYINEKLVAEGPARGDLDNWYYETIDLAPFLKNEANVLAVQVTNFGENRPLAQITNQTGLWVEANDEKYDFFNTGSGNWKVLENQAYNQIPFGPSLHHQYYVCGPGDSLNFEKYPNGWHTTAFDDESWQTPTTISKNAWTLTIRDIPMMANRDEKVEKIVRTAGFQSPSRVLNDLTIPARSEVTLLLDRDSLTMGYPRLFFSNGKGSEIKLTYAESLFENPKKKGNRSQIEGKEILGYYDLVKPDGKENRVFEPLWLRTFRYIQLDIKTGDEPLTIDKLVNRFHVYPVTFDYSFESSELAYSPFMPVGERTLQLCMGETYYDCPYYEQLQYIGDTRIQALITLYLSNDDQLVRKAIKQFYQTLSDNGLTNSRHPAHIRQVIPGFSMYWISMLHDYMMLRDDIEFVKKYYPGVDEILSYFEPFIDDSKMLTRLNWGDTVAGGLPEYWYFTDWSRGFHRGMPQGVYDNSSSVITLHYANTLLQASNIASHLKDSGQAKRYKEQAGRLIQGTLSSCYDQEKGLIAQTPEKKLFAQHPNILGILTDAFPLDQQKLIMRKILEDPSLIQCSMYFRFYLFEALKKLDMDHEIPKLLDFWHQSLEMGLTTFPEKEGNTRSDCHGWNASPLYIFLSSYAGVEPLEPGFKRVKISPRLVHQKEVRATVPHPNGEIVVEFKKEKRAIIGTIDLPANTEGVFEFENHEMMLKAGSNEINTNKK